MWHLDPVTEDSGVAQRLRALNLLKVAPAMTDSHAHDQVAAEYLTEALCAFQRRNGLPETGAVDDATRAALESAHGA